MALILMLIIFVFLLSFALAGLSFAPWVPAWNKDLPRIFRLANLQPREIFYDLGCGNGRVVFYAAKNFQAKAIGLEIAWPLYVICKIRQLFSANRKAVIKFKSLFTEDLSQADVVYFFGMPAAIAKLKPKLEKELKPGCRVISYTFPILGWLEQVKDKPQSTDIAIYLYVR